jgi:hypothetical protein
MGKWLVVSGYSDSQIHEVQKERKKELTADEDR